MKDKLTTALLAFFLGSIGVHRFYLGQTMYGVLYLLFCWTFIPTIIAFIDFIVFLVMTEERFNEKYNKGKVPYYTNNGLNTADEIAKLHKLMREGIITIEEFERRKSQLI